MIHMKRSQNHHQLFSSIYIINNKKSFKLIKNLKIKMKIVKKQSKVEVFQREKSRHSREMNKKIMIRAQIMKRMFQNFLQRYIQM